MWKIFIKIICVLLFICQIGYVHAEIWDIGHWRDSTWGQIPGTSFWWFNFDSEIRNDGIYTKPNDSTIQVSEAGDYLIITTTHDEDTSNGRYNSQLTISQIAWTGDVFSTHNTWFSRDNSENQSWTRWVGIVIGASANSQFQVQKRRDTDAPIGWSVINSSDIQIVKLDQTNYWIYDIGGTGNIYWWTTPNTVDITTVSSQSNTASIEWNTGTDTITLKWDNKTYLVAWWASFDSGNTRTQRIGHLEYDNVDKLSTRSYCYNRNAANEYCWLGSMDIIRTSTADIDLQTEIYRWDGVWADQGWALVDWNLVTDWNWKIIILEMPDSLKVFSSQDSTGFQDITTAQTLNIARDVNVSDTTSFTKASDTTVSVTNPSDVFSWANIWTARSNISSWARQTSYGSIVIDWVEQTVWRHGNYSRWNQWTTDTFAMWFHPAGIFSTVWAGITIWVNTAPLAWWEAGWNDRTQPWTLGFFTINLDTLVPIPPILWVTYTDNDVDNTVQTSQIIQYSIDIENSWSDATGILATLPIDSDFWTPYWFTYSNCWGISSNFTDPNLTFSNISILWGVTCNIIYYNTVDSWATNWSNILSSIDVSAANEGGVDPANIAWDTLNVIACGLNEVNIEFLTDNWWYETFWSLTPTWNTCGVWEIASWWNTTQVNCTSWWSRSASNWNWYANNSTNNEWPFSLNVWSSYDLHVVDDYWDWITTAPDVIIQQNWSTSDTFVVDNNGWVFTFTVDPIPSCSDSINPEVTINQENSQPDPTTINDIKFQVVFNEAVNVSTFTAADITISGTTGVITSWPNEIFPNNGSRFEFTVSWMTTWDIVTASIAAGWIQDLFGNFNNTSTSTDNQVTYNWVTSIISPGWVSTNLQIWLKADQWPNNTTDGGSVTSWADQSDNGFDATSWVAPIYRNNTTDELNFNPVVDFNGTNQYLQNLNNGAFTQSYFLVVVPDNTVDGTATWQVPYWFNCNSWVLNVWTCWLDFAWVTLWAFTAAFNDEIITQAIGSSASWRAAQLWLASYEGWKPMLIGINENSTADGTDIYEKWVSLNNFEANTYQTVSNTDFALWRSLDNTYPFYYDGKIAEVINYSDRISDIDREKIESYLSLKYWITLQDGTQDYVASDGTTLIWSTSIAGWYINDIFWIWYDSTTELWQVKSKSSNSDSVVTIEAIWEWSNLVNNFNDISDKEFLTISNDWLGNTWSAVWAPSWYYNLARSWRIQETGEVWTVNLDFDVANTNFDIPDLSIWTDFYFIYDTDNDNDFSDETPTVMTNVSWDIWRISGVDLDHLREFTIATQASTNNIPTDIFLSNTVVNENIAANSVVWTLSTTDTDGSDTHTYSLVAGSWDDDNIKVSLTWNTIRLIYSPDFEIKPSYNIRIQTDDGNGWQFQKALTITVNDIWEVISSIVDFEIDDKYSITSWNWIRDWLNVNEGSNSLRSDIVGIASTQACFIVEHTFAADGTIEFDYSIDSQLNWDFLRFYIDNIEQNSWSGTVWWTRYSKNDVTAGFHEYKWCYIKNGATNTWNDNAIIDYITFQSNSADTTDPTISGTNFSNNDLLPGWNHDIIFTYFDSESGIDTLWDNITVNKWNWSSWWGDISATTLNLWSKTVTATQARYSTNNIDYGRYRFNFSIDDNDGNTWNTTLELYFDRPTININADELDLWNLNDWSLEFSNDEIIITVNTVGAWFDVNMSQDNAFAYGSNIIINWDGSEWIWYDKTTYTLTNFNINSNPALYSQSASLNTNGDYNTYEYRVKIWTLIWALQAAWNYETQLSFYLYLSY